MPQHTRREIRLNRYSQLRQQGFSPVEARRLRDQSSANIRQQVDTVETRITRTRVAERTEVDRERITAIRRIRREERSEPATRGLIESRSTRHDNFRNWTGKKNFPPAIHAWIERQNLQAGFDPLNSFGYRVFFHRYVNGVSEIEALRRVERRDT